MDSMDSILCVNIVESVLDGKPYERCLQGFQILSAAIEQIKWDAFWIQNEKEKFSDETLSISIISNALISKKESCCREEFNICTENTITLLQNYL